MSETSGPIKFTLDGREVEAPAGETIFRTARRYGIELPNLCYSPAPGYRPDGNCRVCMVEIEGERVLAASCIRTPSPGMKVKTETDRARTARYGLNTGDVNTVVQAAMAGTVASQVLEGDRFFNLTVRLAPQYRNSIEAIGNIKVGYQTSSGANAYIPLRELATISLDTGPAYIYHEAMNRDIPVKFSVRGRDLGSTVAEVQERIARSVNFPRGYRLEWAGEFQDLQLAKQRLAVFVPMSLGLILILLYSLFNSVRDSLLAVAGIPFAIGG